MENLNIFKKEFKKLKLRMAVLTLTITAGAATLAGCKNNTNNTPTPTKPIEVTIDPTEELTPTGVVNPTGEVTPTVTPTPIPVKTLQEVEEELKNVKVSIDDLMNEDVVYPTYFGAVSDNLTNEVLKRTAYFESKGLNFNQAKALVVYLNYCYLNSDAVDKEKADNYLSILNKYDDIELRNILTQLIEYNLKNPDNQIVISWGAIDNALGKDGRAVINNRQLKTTKLLINEQSFGDEFISIEKYNMTATRKDGDLIQITGAYDDLNIATKYMDVSIPYSSAIYILNTRGYSESIENTIHYLSNYKKTILPAFSDPEHANVRRHGFDANAYYEEDLDKISNTDEVTNQLSK